MTAAPLPAVSQAAIDLIVFAEVSSEAHYRAALQRPTWPGGASGVTIGIGYDLGYQDPEQIRADWAGRLPDDVLGRLARCARLAGRRAALVLPSVADVAVPWEAAEAVFRTVTLPEYTRRTLAAFPGCDRLPADCLGALVSLVYNRGDAMGEPNADGSPDGRLEMRQVRAAVAAGQPQRVPALILAMRRLWPTVGGLLARRQAEADLFAAGLAGRAAPSEPALSEADALNDAELARHRVTPA